jgi:protein gp37
MSTGTSIEWTDATWNPTRGCSRVSEGCRNCYAERFAARMPWGDVFARWTPSTAKTAAGATVRVRSEPRWTGVVRLIPEKLDEPLRWKKPRRIFVNSMSDLFHESLPDAAIDRVFAVMAWCRRHTYQILTKRAVRMRAYGLSLAALSPKERTRRLVASMYLGHPAARLVGGNIPDEQVGDLEWPLPNVWLGVSVEDQATADERIPLLLQTPAAKRFISYEPALGPMDFGSEALCHAHDESCRRISDTRCDQRLGPLDWVIVGGESGPGARPFDIAWARSTVAQCKAARVPVFVKQLGARPFASPRHDGGTGYVLELRDRKGGDPAEWDEDLRVREFPA